MYNKYNIGLMSLPLFLGLHPCCYWFIIGHHHSCLTLVSFLLSNYFSCCFRAKHVPDFWPKVPSCHFAYFGHYQTHTPAMTKATHKTCLAHWYFVVILMFTLFESKYIECTIDPVCFHLAEPYALLWCGIDITHSISVGVYCSSSRPLSLCCVFVWALACPLLFLAL